MTPPPPPPPPLSPPPPLPMQQRERGGAEDVRAGRPPRTDPLRHLNHRRVYHTAGGQAEFVCRRKVLDEPNWEGYFECEWEFVYVPPDFKIVWSAGDDPMEYRLVLRDEINQRMSQLDHRIQKLQKKNDALTEEVKRLRDAPPTPSPPEDHPAIEYWRTRYLALANAVRLGAVQPKDASTHTQMPPAVPPHRVPPPLMRPPGIDQPPQLPLRPSASAPRQLQPSPSPFPPDTQAAGSWQGPPPSDLPSSPFTLKERGLLQQQHQQQREGGMMPSYPAPEGQPAPPGFAQEAGRLGGAPGPPAGGGGGVATRYGGASRRLSVTSATARPLWQPPPPPSLSRTSSALTSTPYSSLTSTTMMQASAFPSSPQTSLPSAGGPSMESIDTVAMEDDGEGGFKRPHGDTRRASRRIFHPSKPSKQSGDTYQLLPDVPAAPPPAQPPYISPATLPPPRPPPRSGRTRSTKDASSSPKEVASPIAASESDVPALPRSTSLPAAAAVSPGRPEGTPRRNFSGTAFLNVYRDLEGGMPKTGVSSAGTTTVGLSVSGATTVTQPSMPSSMAEGGPGAYLPPKSAMMATMQPVSPAPFPRAPEPPLVASGSSPGSVVSGVSFQQLFPRGAGAAGGAGASGRPVTPRAERRTGRLPSLPLINPELQRLSSHMTAEDLKKLEPEKYEE